MTSDGSSISEFLRTDCKAMQTDVQDKEIVGVKRVTTQTSYDGEV